MKEKKGKKDGKNIRFKNAFLNYFFTA